VSQKVLPTHRCELVEPGGRRTVVSECVPVKKLGITGYCKYCYTTHRDWWQMKQEDYGRDDIVLCGKCEHTSMRGHI